MYWKRTNLLHRQLFSIHLRFISNFLERILHRWKISRFANENNFIFDHYDWNRSNTFLNGFRFEILNLLSNVFLCKIFNLFSVQWMNQIFRKFVLKKLAHRYITFECWSNKNRENQVRKSLFHWFEENHFQR